MSRERVERVERFEGFVAFARTQSRPLFRSAYLLTGDWHLAEDLVQETLGRMFSNWSGVERIDNPAAYAQTVVVRTYLSHRRRRSATEYVSADVSVPAVWDGDPALRVALLAALDGLSNQDRAVLVLRYLNDRSVAQVATDLSRSPVMIRVQSARALQRLRAVLGDGLADLRQP